MNNDADVLIVLRKLFEKTGSLADFATLVWGLEPSVYEMIAQVLPGDMPEEACGLSDWVNSAGRTRYELLKMLDRAIASARKNLSISLQDSQ